MYQIVIFILNKSCALISYDGFTILILGLFSPLTVKTNSCSYVQYKSSMHGRQDLHFAIIMRQTVQVSKFMLVNNEPVVIH